MQQYVFGAARVIGRSGMAAAFAQQLEQPELQALSFEERFSLLVDRELNLRENHRLNRLLQLARLRQLACVEDIDYTHRRALERSLMATLVTCDWICAHHNLHLTWPYRHRQIMACLRPRATSLPPGTPRCVMNEWLD